MGPAHNMDNHELTCFRVCLDVTILASTQRWSRGKYFSMLQLQDLVMSQFPLRQFGQVLRNATWKVHSRRTSDLPHTSTTKVPHTSSSSSPPTANMTSTPTPYPTKAYTPRYPKWPYSPSDFQRTDPTPDALFYHHPRLVTHIDDAAITRLTAYYAAALPQTGTLLDLCTSWKSFYPPSLHTAIHSHHLTVYGLGLNALEMQQNPVFRDQAHWRVFDLNAPPYQVRAAWPQVQCAFDAVTCVVSIDYLVEPLEVCRGLLDVTAEGGRVHFVLSNRCFATKVVRKWMMLDEQARLELVGDYLHFSGWQHVEIVDLCARDEAGKRIADDTGRVVVRDAGLPDHLDPLWVVAIILGLIPAIRSISPTNAVVTRPHTGSACMWHVCACILCCTIPSSSAMYVGSVMIGGKYWGNGKAKNDGKGNEKRGI
ncbi:hypothetical protein IAQ61_007473, partial [Plenodomus lingam]|uniref:uncharacterized protein n=1 Tax=Leptosphaeria maculans TaxID=5022 RepID=UPI003319E856